MADKPKSKASRKQIDWEAIEREYRMGQKSMRTIADEFGVNVSNISRRAKKEKWVQDKSDEIRQRTKASLVAQQEGNAPSRDDIDRAVESNVRVIREHRKEILSARNLVNVLSAQLASAAENRDAIEQVIIEETKGADGQKPNLKRRNAMLKAVALQTHFGALRDLSFVLKNLIPLERQAFNIDEEAKRPEKIEEISLNFVTPDHPAEKSDEN